MSKLALCLSQLFFRLSVFIKWARMQLPFLFVQDCLSETSELVLVDEWARMSTNATPISFRARLFKWNVWISFSRRTQFVFFAKKIIYSVCLFLGWLMVTAASWGRRLCYRVPETLYNISERLCTKRPLRHNNREL